MKKYAALATMMVLLTLHMSGGDLADRAAKLTREQMQGVIEFLASDALEGRAPGTRGGELAELFMYDLFKLLGLKSRFQPFDLHGFQLGELNIAAGKQALLYRKDTVGSYVRPEADFSFAGDAVFVGFGIRTPLWSWDDYKNADLRGKVLLVRVNDPGLYVPQLFDGSALTYFGRWTCKVEEAAKTGAAAILLIHTTPTAGYDWQVVKNSWSGEEFYLPASLENDLKFRGWISEQGLKSLLAERNISLERLYRKSLSRKFRPVDLGFKISISGRNSFRLLKTRNVVGEIPGRSGKNIVLSAHIDHFGRNGQLDGDQIFNGAIDNGSAVATMALVAKICADAGQELHYGLTFVACQAEEAGLLGSKYFVANSEREKIAACINFESTPVWGKALDAFAEGARYSTLEDAVRLVAAAQGLGYSQFSLTDQGLFYRSDQFPFAQAGIPAIWLSAGEKFASGRNHIAEFFKGGAYHTVKDEFDPAWELESLRQTVKLAAGLIEHLNLTREIPHWKTRLTFPLEASPDKTLR